MPMPVRQWEVGRVGGVAIVIDPSWFLVLVFLTWGLAVGYFPVQVPHLDPFVYWGAGLLATLGLFASVTLHELGHSAVARRRGIPVRRIVLFVFGGVSQLEGEPEDPRSEFVMAIVGPLISLALAGALFLARGLVSSQAGWPLLYSFFGYLAGLNLALALFNLLPGFPLDGGRVLRSFLWRRWRNSLRATRVASEVGSMLGLGLIGVGLLSILFADAAGGIWYLLIGFFLRNAANASYQQAVFSGLSKGVTVRSLMTANPLTVAPDLPLDRFVEQFILGHHHPAFPVMDGDKLAGMADMERVKSIPRADWPLRTVRDIARPLWESPTVGCDDDVAAAMQKMAQDELGRVLVVDGAGKLCGILSRRDIMDYLALKAGLPNI
jgi:Zn-dependent protease/predicted transcriptional regulator